MSEGGVGRVLAASLHQGIADLLPARLEFYESWLNPVGLRDGRIGVAPFAAVLSFLRQEGEAYQTVTSRAGEYAAEWTMAGLSETHRTVMRAAPEWIRLRLGLGVVRRMVHGTFAGSRAIARAKRGGATITVRGSVFCEVRDRADGPLCAFYASAVRRLMQLIDLDADVDVEQCRATGGDGCRVELLVRRRNPR
jgi:bacteriochlorophyll 4-vinyl reductase